MLALIKKTAFTINKCIKCSHIKLSLSIFFKSNNELSHYTYYSFHSDFHVTDDTFRRIESVYDNSDFHRFNYSLTAFVDQKEEKKDTGLSFSLYFRLR